MKIPIAFKQTGWAKTGVLMTAALITGAVLTYHYYVCSRQLLVPQWFPKLLTLPLHLWRRQDI